MDPEEYSYTKQYKLVYGKSTDRIQKTVLQSKRVFLQQFPEECFPKPFPDKCYQRIDVI